VFHFSSSDIVQRIIGERITDSSVACITGLEDRTYRSCFGTSVVASVVAVDSTSAVIVAVVGRRISGF
jgi:hypothetical protein